MEHPPMLVGRLPEKSVPAAPVAVAAAHGPASTAGRAAIAQRAAIRVLTVGRKVGFARIRAALRTRLPSKQVAEVIRLDAVSNHRDTELCRTMVRVLGPAVAAGISQQAAAISLDEPARQRASAFGALRDSSATPPLTSDREGTDAPDTVETVAPPLRRASSAPMPPSSQPGPHRMRAAVRSLTQSLEGRMLAAIRSRLPGDVPDEVRSSIHRRALSQAERELARFAPAAPRDAEPGPGADRVADPPRLARCGSAGAAPGRRSDDEARRAGGADQASAGPAPVPAAPAHAPVPAALDAGAPSGTTPAEVRHALVATAASMTPAAVRELHTLTRWARWLRSVAVAAGTAPPSTDGGRDGFPDPQARARAASFLRHCSSCSAPLPGSAAAAGRPAAECPVRGRPCAVVRKAVAVTGQWSFLGLPGPPAAGRAADAVDLEPERAALRRELAGAAANAQASATRTEWVALQRVAAAASSRSLSSLLADEAALDAVARRAPPERAAKRRRPADDAAPDALSSRPQPGPYGTLPGALAMLPVIETPESHPALYPGSATLGRGGLTLAQALVGAHEPALPTYRPPPLARNTAALAVRAAQVAALVAPAVDADGAVRVFGMSGSADGAEAAHPGVPLE